MIIIGNIIGKHFCSSDQREADGGGDYKRFQNFLDEEAGQKHLPQRRGECRCSGGGSLISKPCLLMHHCTIHLFMTVYQTIKIYLFSF